MAVSQNGSGSVTGRVMSLGRLVGTLDQRLVETFDTLDRVGEAAGALDGLAADGEGLIGELRSRMLRLDRKVNADLDEVKAAVLAKLDQIDVIMLMARLEKLETSIGAIENAVTRLDTVVEGAVEAAPDFVTRKVREAGDEVEEEIAQDVA